MDDLKTITDVVKYILMTFPETRNSDDALYIKVCEQINPKSINQSFWFVHRNLKELNLPKFESVRRSRQKIQASHPELAAEENVECQRILNEEVFREYARGV